MAWSVRACHCSFCRSHGAITTSDPAGSLAFGSPDATQVHRYQFSSRSAYFLICRDCGVYLGAEMATAAGRFGVLNVLALRPLLATLPDARPKDYGAETAGVRQLRRESRWTPVAANSL